MTWIRPDEAAAALAARGTVPSIPTLRVIAHRENWRRIRIGHQVAYHLDDVTDTALRRHNTQRLASNLTHV